MSWVNECQWFLLFLLTMKVLLWWTVLSWVSATTAHRDGHGRCVYITSGSREIEFQTGCDCMRLESGLPPFDDSAIYYQPEAFLPTYIYDNSFRILDPVLETETIYSHSQAATSDARSDTRRRNSEIEINVESAPSHSRNVKDVQTYREDATAPIYLDLDIERGPSGRSASTDTLIVEDLRIMEQNILGCVELHTEFKNRQRGTENHRSSQSEQYQHLSNADLIKAMDDKCSHTSKYVEKNLNEIKEKRPKKTSSTIRTSDNGPRELEHSQIRIGSDGNPEFQDVRENKFNEKKIENSVNNEIENASEIEASPPINTRPQVTSTDLVPSSSASKNSDNEPEDNMEVNFTTVTQNLGDNQYPLSTDKTIADANPTDPESLTRTIVEFEKSNSEESNSQPPEDQEFRATEIKTHGEERPAIEEGDAPLVRVFTHEFGNDTVQSIVSGTEDIANEEFEDEIRPAETGDLEEVTSETSRSAQYDGATQVDTTASETQKSNAMFSDLSGNLYLLYDEQHIPVRFVQTHNGTLQLGIDGATLCHRLTENSENNSAMLRVLCKCYKSGNCTHKK